jgi:hypothetical protein
VEEEEKKDRHAGGVRYAQEKMKTEAGSFGHTEEKTR